MALAIVTSGCPTSPEPDKPPCVGRLTGALSGTFTCEVQLAYDSPSDTTTIQFDVTNFTGTALDLLLQGTTFEGIPVEGTLTEQTPAVGTFNTAIGGTDDAPIVYFAAWNQGSFPDLGTFSLTLTGVETGEGNPLVAHGEFVATMVPFPADETAGTVTVDISF